MEPSIGRLLITGFITESKLNNQSILVQTSLDLRSLQRQSYCYLEVSWGLLGGGKIHQFPIVHNQNIIVSITLGLKLSNFMSSFSISIIRDCPSPYSKHFGALSLWVYNFLIMCQVIRLDMIFILGMVEKKLVNCCPQISNPHIY